MNLKNFDQGMVETVNKMGITTLELAPITHSFIEYVKQCEKPVLDLGCGYGFSALEALKAGGRVIAFDLAQAHLDVLRRNTPPMLQSQLTTLSGRFPNDLNLEANSLAAVHAALVLHFLKGEEILEGLKRLYHYLQPGGEIFLATMSVYVGVVENSEALLKEYQMRIDKKDPWPGYFKLSPYVKPEWIRILPEYGYFFKIDTAVDFVTRAGFEVLEAYYYRLHSFSDQYKSNGKEQIAIRAVKL